MFPRKVLWLKVAECVGWVSGQNMDFFFLPVLTGRVGFYVDLKSFCVNIGVSAMITKTYSISFQWYITYVE